MNHQCIQPEEEDCVCLLDQAQNYSWIVLLSSKLQSPSQDFQKLIMEQVVHDPTILKNHPSIDRKRDRRLLMRCVLANPSTLEYFPHLCEEREVAIPLLRMGEPFTHILNHANNELFSDREFVKQVYREIDSFNVSYSITSSFADVIGESLRKDREIVMLAVSCSNTLRCFDRKFGNDRQVVLAAVKYEGSALAHAHPSFRYDPEILVSAFESAGKRSLFYCENEDFVKDVVGKDGLNYQCLSPSMKHNREVALIAVKSNSQALQFVPENLKEIVVEGLKQ